MAFIDDVGYYAGSTSGKGTEVSKFLANGVQYIISVIEKANPDMLSLFASNTTLPAGSATSLALTTNSKVLDVVRNNADSNGEVLKCSPMNPAFRSNAINVDSIYYASSNSPIYYTLNSVLYVLPTPTSAQFANISRVLPGTVNSADIDNFPSEMYHGVVLYASGQLLHNKMTVLNSKLPTDLDSDTTVFNAIEDLNEALAIGSLLPTWDTNTSLPNGIVIGSALPKDFAIDSSLPSINISSVLDTGYQSAITKASSLIDVGIATNELSAESNDVTGTKSAGYWLDTEDEEMVQSTLSVAAQELQRASTILQKFQSDVSNEVQNFNIDMQAYQANIAKESADINAAAQKVSTELSMDSTIASTDVSIYQAELQKEQTRFNAEITKYQADIAKASKTIDVKMAEFSTNLQKKISLYTTLISKLTTDYQWLQGQYQLVKAEFSEFMTPYTTGSKLDSTVEGVRR